MPAMNSRALLAIVTMLVAVLQAPSAIAQAQTQASSTVDCAALAAMKIPNTNLLSAALVPAKDGLPEYCRVLGYVRPAINFEIRLRPSELTLMDKADMEEESRYWRSGLEARNAAARERASQWQAAERLIAEAAGILSPSK